MFGGIREAEFQPRRYEQDRLLIKLTRSRPKNASQGGTVIPARRKWESRERIHGEVRTKVLTPKKRRNCHSRSS